MSAVLHLRIKPHATTPQATQKKQGGIPLRTLERIDAWDTIQSDWSERS